MADRAREVFPAAKNLPRRATDAFHRAGTISLGQASIGRDIILDTLRAAALVGCVQPFDEAAGSLVHKNIITTPPRGLR